jgi:filamentous hemagglutinin family protein
MTTIKRRNNTRKSGKRSLSLAIAVTVSVILSGHAGLCSSDLPSGEQVVSGQASVDRSGSAMTVNQTSDKAIFNWQSFNIGSSASVAFRQPSSTSVALNRVLSADPSKIYGTLTANGQIFLVNPSGILFGKDSRVNVGGLVASTMAISDADFNAGSYRFTRNGSRASILNLGTISAANGGVAALLSTDIQNDGIIEARLGSVILASGETATLTMSDNALYSVVVDPSEVSTLIDNKGILQADGGRILMRSSTANDLLGSVVNTSGVVQARSMGDIKGEISIIGDMRSGSALFGGRLDASAPNGGNGGFIETSAANVRIADGTIVTTDAPNGERGNWLIDPQDFTIGSTNTGTITAGSPSGEISGATLSSALGLSNVTILSSQGSNAAGYGDINVNDNVTWWKNTLTLTASRNININAVMTLRDANPGVAIEANDARLVMNTATANGSDAAVAGGNVLVGLTPDGFVGKVNFDRSGTGVLTINTNPYTVIKTLGAQGSVSKLDLQGMKGNSIGYYALGGDIDAHATATWNSGLGFEPIGPVNTNGIYFGGVFDGLGHVIYGLYINRPNAPTAGLFGRSSVGNNTRTIQFRNVGLEKYINGSTIIGSVTGGKYTGSILGGVYEGAVIIANVYNRLDITGTQYTGGITGSSWKSDVTNVFNTGSVTGTSLTGGISGYIIYGSLAQSFNSGTVYGVGDSVGGLFGNGHEAALSNSFNTGSVTGTGTYVGGLFGYISNTTNIKYSYNTGSVVSLSAGSAGGIGGFSNYGASSLSYCYWDKQASGITVGLGNYPTNVTINNFGKTTAEMKSLSNFSAWSLSDSYDTSKTWRIYSGDTYPMLRWTLLTPSSSLTTGSDTKVYDKIAYSGTPSMAMSDGSALPGGIYYSSMLGAINAGSYSVGLWSTKYDLNVIKGTLSITAKPLSVTATGVDRVYDGTLNSTATFSTTDLILGDTLGYTCTGLFADKNVGTGKTLTISGITLSGSSMLNYSLQNTTASTTASITQRALTVTATGINREYDSTTGGSVALASAEKVSGDNLDFAYLNALFDDKNVGTGKTLSVSGISLSGADLLNYSLQNTTASTTADITAKALQVSGLAGVNREYDGTNQATLSGTASISPFSGDVVALGGTARSTFANKAVGDGKEITVSGYSISGDDSGNYTIEQPSGLKANISKATLLFNGLTAESKVYDASAVATLNGTASISVFGNDVVMLDGTASGSFIDKNAGTGKAVVLSGLSISGADAASYTLTQPGLTADITPRDLPVYGLSAKEKVYDSTTTATLTGTASIMALSGDEVTIGGSARGEFADKNVGTSKAVRVTGNSISGTDAANYTLIQQRDLTADITPRDLPVYGLSAKEKVYDSTTTATLTGSASIMALSGDEVNIGGSARGEFADKNVGTARAVSVTGNSISGADAANYTLVQQRDLSADITPRDLPVYGLLAKDKVYDSTTTATLTGTASIMALSGDEVNIGGSARGEFADKNVGTSKAVSVTGNSISGADAANYTIIQQRDLSADISPRDLPVYGLSAKNKFEDGTTVATLSGRASIMTYGDDKADLGGTASGTFATSGAGNNIPVTVAGNTISGADAANYRLIQQSPLIADIYPAPVSGSTAYTAGTQNAIATKSNETTTFTVIAPSGNSLAAPDNLRVAYVSFGPTSLSTTAVSTNEQ